MVRLFELGSIVKVRNVRLMVTGYELKVKNEKYQVVYTAVPFPQGFRSTKSVVVISTEEAELLQRGYTSTENDIMRDFFENMGKIVDVYSAEEMNKYFEQLADRVDKEIKNE